MTVDCDEDLEGLRRAGAVVAEARKALLEAAEPGVSTADLDALAREIFRKHGARSAPRLAYDFPGSVCVSVNDEAAHGIPSKQRFLKAGDIVNVDISAELDGYWADTGASTGVGEVSPTITRLLEATRAAQRDATAAAKAGRALRTVGRAVEARARKAGFSIVRDLYGHGVGRSLHEEPSVPSFDDGSRGLLWEGAVLAIEPFLSISATSVVTQADGWTLSTNDGSLVAQFEHTVVVTRGDALVMTA